MAKDPAFLFYHHDFLIGTAFLTLEDCGAYIKILCHLADKGSLSLRDIKVLCGSNYDPTSLLEAKFCKNSEAHYYHKRLNEEVDRRKNWCKSRNNNKKGKNQYSRSYDQNKIGHTTGHMVNADRAENEDAVNHHNKNSIHINTTKKQKGFVRDNPPTIEEINGYCIERKNKVDSKAFFDSNTAVGWVDKNGNEYRDWKAVVRKWENWDTSTTPQAPIKRPLQIILLELVAQGKNWHDIKYDLVGKYIEKDIDEAISRAKSGKLE